MDKLRDYFDGRMTADEERNYQQWMIENEHNLEFDRMLNDLFGEIQLSNDRLARKAFDTVAARLEIKSVRIRKIMESNRIYKILFIAVCLLLPVLGIWVYEMHIRINDISWTEIKVPEGQTKQLLLSDGTCLYLNAGSRITYPDKFYGRERRIFIDGELYADVAPDTRHPFVIQSKDVSLTVLGTTFNFKAYQNSECVEVLLVEGAVNLDIRANDKIKQVNLQPGDMMQYDRISGNIELGTFNRDTYQSFYKERSFRFYKLKMKDIVNDLQRTFNTRIVIVDEELEDMRFLAFFTNNETLDQILASINAGGRMRIEKRNSSVYLYKSTVK